MPKRFLPYLFYLLLLLAMFGFANQLFRDPVNTIIIIALSALVFFGLRHYLTGRRLTPNPRLQRKAADRANSKTATKRHLQTTRRQHPFQVIDGHKGKTKDKPDVKDRNFPQ
ncbi:MAG: hypothetical protein ACM32O_06740 [Clostridia bacterium]